MNWVLIVGVTWLAVSVVAAAVIAGAIRVAEQHRREEAEAQRRAAAEAGVPSPFARHRRSPAGGRRRSWRRVRKTAVGEYVPSSEGSGSARETGAR